MFFLVNFYVVKRQVYKSKIVSLGDRCSVAKKNRTKKVTRKSSSKKLVSNKSGFFSKKLLLQVVLVLGIVGLLTSIYLTSNHYSTVEGGSACDFSEHVSCSLVNSSTFSEMFNVPVAIFGVVWFIVLVLLVIKSLMDTKSALELPLVIWSLVGLLSVIYFVIAEIILQALCPFCTVVHVIVLLILGLSIWMCKGDKKATLKKFKVGNYRGWIALTIILNLLPLLYFNVFAGEQEDHSSLAQCITESGVDMYGSFRCGICAKTRSMFGDAFEGINEIECHPQGEDSEWELCQEKKISGTPTWIKEVDGLEIDRHTGFLSINELREFSGCTQ